MELAFFFFWRYQEVISNATPYTGCILSARREFGSFDLKALSNRGIFKIEGVIFFKYHTWGNHAAN